MSAVGRNHCLTQTFDSLLPILIDTWCYKDDWTVVKVWMLCLNSLILKLEQCSDLCIRDLVDFPGHSLWDTEYRAETHWLLSLLQVRAEWGWLAADRIKHYLGLSIKFFDPIHLDFCTSQGQKWNCYPCFFFNFFCLLTFPPILAKSQLSVVDSSIYFLLLPSEVVLLHAREDLLTWR